MSLEVVKSTLCCSASVCLHVHWSPDVCLLTVRIGSSFSRNEGKETESIEQGETIKTWNKDPASKPGGWSSLLASMREAMFGSEHIFGFYSVHVSAVSYVQHCGGSRLSSFLRRKKISSSCLFFLPCSTLMSTASYPLSFPRSLHLMDYVFRPYQSTLFPVLICLYLFPTSPPYIYQVSWKSQTMAKLTNMLSVS